MRAVAAILVIVTMAGCAIQQPVPIEFLTREGCVQTKLMRVRLDSAIEAVGTSMPYTVVDLDSLAADDARRGYPTPTILRGGVDVFGMAKPTPPYPEPT